MTKPAVASRTSVDSMAREIASLRKQVRALSRQPRLTNSAIDDGALITTVGGEDGRQLTAVLGQQWDGTNGLIVTSGPVPPTPSIPAMTTVPGGVLVEWNGTYPDQPGYTTPVVAPGDFAGVTVEVCTNPDFATATVFRGTITSPAGGHVSVSWPLTGANLYARLITKTTAGRSSLPSLTAGPTVSGKVGLTDLGFNIADYTGGGTIYYTTGAAPTPPAGTNFKTGDLWLKQVGTSAGGTGQPPSGTPLYETWRWLTSAWVRLEAQGISSAAASAVAAQVAADSKAKLFTQTTTPTWSGAAGTAYWIDTSVAGSNVTKVWNGTTFTTYQLGNGAIAPNSLVASNVIATGTITAALLEALLVLATTVVAGDPNGSHARMTSTGFRVYRPDPDTPGTAEEVIRMGTDTNDYFGIVNSAGVLVASVDDTGGFHGNRGDFEIDLTVGGRSVTALISESTQPVGSFRGTLPNSGGGSFYGPIGAGTANRVGMAEVNGMLVAGQRYRIDWQCVWTNVTAWDEAVFSIHPKATTTSGSATAPAPLVTDTATEQWLDFLPSAGNRWKTAAGSTEYTAAISGRHRFLLALRGGDSNTGAIHGISDSRFPLSLSINPLGPAKPNAGQFSQGGGTYSGGTPPAAPPTPVQRYDTGWMAPAGWRTFGGSGAERFDVAGPVQGWDPSGYNGDGHGYWWWSLPSISGTVDEVWVWLYSSHWYYNSGGTARLWPINAAAGSPGPTGPYDVGGFPKPGSVQVNISGWAAYFHNNQGTNRAIGVQVGPGGGTNLLYYGKFDGPSARLLIRYTQ